VQDLKEHPLRTLAVTVVLSRIGGTTGGALGRGMAAVEGEAAAGAGASWLSRVLSVFGKTAASAGTAATQKTALEAAAVRHEAAMARLESLRKQYDALDHWSKLGRIEPSISNWLRTGQSRPYISTPVETWDLDEMRGMLDKAWEEANAARDALKAASATRSVHPYR